MRLFFHKLFGLLEEADSLWIQGVLMTSDQEAAQGINYANVTCDVLDEMGLTSSSKICTMH